MRKSELTVGSIVIIGVPPGARYAIKHADGPDEGYNWRYINSDKLVDYDDVYKATWDLVHTPGRTWEDGYTTGMADSARFEEALRAAASDDSKHVFAVFVDGCTVEQAQQVMAERINHDEDYGFHYTIGWS